MIDPITCPKCGEKYKALTLLTSPVCFWCASGIPLPIPAPSVEARNMPAFTPPPPHLLKETDDDQ